MAAEKFQKGVSGNPAGRPKGSKNRATLLAIAAMEGELDAIVRRVIESAKAGDMVAARLVVDKLVPASKDRPVSIDLPDINSAEDCASAQSHIVSSVAGGELLPSEGEALAGLIEYRRKSLETQDFEQRLKAIEERMQK